MIKWSVRLGVVLLVLMTGWLFLLAPDETTGWASALSGKMRIIRPVLVVMLLLAWHPFANRLHATGRLTERGHELVQKAWAPVLIWYVILEIGIGQSLPLAAIVLMALYGTIRFGTARFSAQSKTTNPSSAEDQS